MLIDDSFINSFEPTAKSDGVQQAASQLLQKLGVVGVNVTGTLPQTGPLLIISNHPGILDTLTLLASIPRNDYYFVALVTYAVFGSTMRKKLLPIYRKRQLNHRLWEYPLLLKSGYPIKELAQADLKEKNRQTIAKAAQLINQGNAVSVFPTGSAGKRLKASRWKPGIGFLVRQITNPKTKVICTFLSGSKKRDFIRYLRVPLFRTKRVVSLKISKTRFLGNIINPKNMTGKEITQVLERYYDSEIKTK